MKTLKKTLAVILSVAMVITLTPSLSFATDGTGSGGSTENDGVYVLMNIPYAEFYQAELGDNGVDSITSATKNGKARNVNVNGASYHQSEEAVTTEGIAGAAYPVKASGDELAALKAKGAKEVTDADTIEYEMTEGRRPGSSWKALQHCRRAHPIRTMFSPKLRLPIRN